MSVIFALFLKMFSKKHAETENSNDKYFLKKQQRNSIFFFRESIDLNNHI